MPFNQIAEHAINYILTSGENGLLAEFVKRCLVLNIQKGFESQLKLSRGRSRELGYTDLSLYSKTFYIGVIGSDSGRLTILLHSPLCNYWEVIPQFVPLNGLHTDICFLRIGAVQAERVYIFVQWKFVWEKIKRA